MKYSYKNFKNKKFLIDNLNKTIGFPLVLKPINEGSSVNVFILLKKTLFKIYLNSKNTEKY